MALDQDGILDEGEEEEVNWMAVIIAAVFSFGALFSLWFNSVVRH